MTESTEIWLVRHGETDWNVAWRIQGHTDIPLNEHGREQARQLADTLAAEKFDALYASDLGRAQETARILGAAVHLPVQTEPLLREICHGEWEGKIADQDIDVQLGMLYADPQNAHAPGGETLQQVAERTARALDDISSRHSGERILLVSHGVSLATIICQAEKIPLTQARRVRPENCAARVVRWPA
jgi:alpha-ribazole phosphatase/probable phosphoglycerate mutase